MSETGGESTNYSVKFGATVSKANRGRTVMTPPISGKIGNLTFRVYGGKIRTNYTAVDATASVFLTTATGFSNCAGWPNFNTIYPNSLQTVTIRAADRNSWVDFTVPINKVIPESTPQRVAIGFMNEDANSFDIFIDDIAVLEMPSSLVEESALTTEEGLDYALSGLTGVPNMVHPVIQFMTVGNISNIVSTLHYRFSGETEWRDRMMVQDGDVWRVQSGTLNVGEASGVQLEMYVSTTYDNEEGPQSCVHTYTADHPFVLDILPRWKNIGHENLVVSGAFDVPMTLTTNAVWVGGYEHEGGIQDDTFCFTFGEGPSKSYGNPGYSVPFERTMNAGERSPAPASLDRDLIFRFSEVGSYLGSVFFAEYETFENWGSETNSAWSVAMAEGSDSGVVTDADLAQAGSSAFLLRAGDTLVIDKGEYPGVGEVGLWARRAGTDPVSITLTRRREGQGENEPNDELATFTGLPTDRYAFFGRVLAKSQSPMTTTKIYLTANTDVYLDGVFASDCSSVKFVSMDIQPQPIKQNSPITIVATFQTASGGKVKPDNLALNYGQSFDASCATNEGFFVTSDEGLTWTCTLEEGVSRSDADFYATIYAEAVDYRGENMGQIEIPTLCVPVIPFSEVESVAIEDGASSVEMRLASDRLWKGAIPAPAASPEAHTYWFLDSAGIKRGDASVTAAPSSGTLAQEAEFALSGISTALAFEYNEAEQAYRIQQALYAPMRDATIPAGSGWGYTNASSSDFADGCVKFTPNGTITTPSREGVGQVTFWAARATEAPVTYTISVSTTANGNDFTPLSAVNGGMGTIAGQNMRFFNAIVGDPEVKRVQIKFMGGAAYVQEVIVTASGSFVTMSAPTISLDDGASYSPSDAAQSMLPYGGRPYMTVNLVPQNGAHNVRVSVEAVMADLVNGVAVPVEGADVITVPMVNDIPEADGGTYRVCMPALTAGVTAYRFFAEYDGEDATRTTFPKTADSWYFYETDDALASERVPDFQTLPHNNAAPMGAFLGSDWRLTSMYMWSLAKQAAAFLPTAEQSILTSLKAFNGIGRIYFRTYTNERFGYHDLAVQLSSNGSTWETINTVDVPYGEGTALDPFSQICIEVNDYSPKYVRFIRTSEGSTDKDNIYIRDIVITPPAANMTAVMPSIIHPGYPSKNDAVTFAVDVANVYEEYPAVNAQVNLIWRRVFGSVAQGWQTTPMSSVDGQHFTVTLPAMNPGKLEYYAQVSFSGASYRYVYSKRDNGEVMPIQFYYAWEAGSLDADPRRGNESCSPAFLYSSVDNAAEFAHATEQRALEAPTEYENRFLWFRVRAFESQHDHLQFVYTNALEVVEEGASPTVYTNALQLIGDNLWLTTVNVTNDIHYLARLEGVSPYGGPETTEYLEESTLWGDDDQETINPPLASIAGTEEGDLIEINLGTTKPVTMMVRFDATTGSYQVRRAAYQDFNDWGADTDFFEDSLGLFNVQTYEQVFDNSALYLDTTMGARISSFDTDIVGDYSEDDYFTALGWNLHAGEILRERKPRDEKGGVAIGNTAARIASRGGYLQNENGIGGNREGIDSVALRARATFGADGHTPYDRSGFAWENGFVAVSNVTVTAISDGHPYIQVMAAYQDAYNYVALRLTQRAIVGANQDSLPRLFEELIKVENGVETVLSSSYIVVKDYNKNNPSPVLDASKGIQMELTSRGTQSNGSLDWTFEIDMTSSPIKARVFMLGETSTDVVLTGVASTMGTVSVDTFDAVATFRRFFIGENPTDEVQLKDFSTWALGGPQAGGTGATRWKVNMPSGTTGLTPAITREVPPLRFSIGIAEAGENASMPSGTAFQMGTPFVVGSLGYMDFTKQVHYWGNTFIRIKPELSDADLVVDDVKVSDWRGKSLPEESPTDNRLWQAREAVVTTHNGSRVLALTTSRANPSARQMVATPEMLDGLGTIAFNYEVTGGNVTFVVEYNTVGGAYSENAGYAIARKVQAVNGEKGEIYQAIRLSQTGKIRVRVLQEESSEDATLYLDNFFAKGFPEDDGRSWSAYNALIVAPTRNGLVDAMQFDEDVSTQTAFLNNSIDGDTRQNTAYLEHRPFIQSPVIDTGVGEVAFWYRAWNPKNPTPGQLTFWVAENPDDPDEMWRQVTEADLAIPEKDPGMSDYEYENSAAYISYTNQVASFRSLSNITNGDYQYFSAEFCNDTNFVLRICSTTNDAQRVAIDNIIVTEPVRASIEVLSVTMYPNAIPLGDEPVGFEVRLGNPRMNPTDIHVFADYHIGTNVWGVANWGFQPDAAIELVQDPEDPFLYRSSPGDMIPGLPVDSVVQYRIRVTYTGTFAAPVSSVAFENPSWYEPIDLNQTFAESGFSPYYFVFSCPTGCVYISEFLPSGNTRFDQGEFIELMGPENASIAGWSIDIIDGGSASEHSDSVLESYQLPSNAKFKSYSEKEEKDSGWGFFVIGDQPEDFSRLPAEFAILLERADMVFNNDASRNLPTPGGIRVRRSMGAYVDRVSWGGNSSVAAKSMVDRGYVWAGSRSNIGSENPGRSYMLNLDDETQTLTWALASFNRQTIAEMNTPELLATLGECPYSFSDEFRNASAIALSEYFDKYLPADFLCMLDLNDGTELMKIVLDETDLVLGTDFELDSTAGNTLTLTLKAASLAALNLATGATHTITFDVAQGLDPVVELIVQDSTPETSKSGDVSIHIKGIEVVEGKVILTVTVTNNEPEKSVSGWSWGIQSAASLEEPFALVGDLEPLSDEDVDTDLVKEIETDSDDAAGFYRGVLNDGE